MNFTKTPIEIMIITSAADSTPSGQEAGFWHRQSDYPPDGLPASKFNNHNEKEENCQYGNQKTWNGRNFRVQ